MRAMRASGFGAAIAFVASLMAVALSPGAAAAPQRIVSLNLCIDPIVLDLVPRDRIQALSWVSGDPNVSPILDRLAGIRLVRGAAEEVLALDPDLILAGEHTTPATVDLLRRLGRRVEVVPMARDLDGVRLAIRRVAAAVGEPERGEQMVADFDRRLVTSRNDGPTRPSAIIYQVNSIVSGAGTLAGAALEAAGLTNAGERMGAARSGRVDLETLVVNPPDILALGQRSAAYRTPMADNLRHPALASVLARRTHVDLPMPLWLCGTPHVAEAVLILHRAREGLR
jgi:iron complex transport system substrate-binding protein